jgi:hypothetical protein
MNTLLNALRNFALGVAVLTLLLNLAGCQSSADSATGTLEVRVSDHRVAIGDFERLDITITSVGLHPTNATRTEGWLDFAPHTSTLDMTKYLDGREATILQTSIPTGDYNAVRLVVAEGEGQLKVGGTAFVEGFSQAAALQFAVHPGQTTTLLLDLLVESADDHPGGGYSMNLLSATLKRDPYGFFLLGGGIVLLAVMIGGVSLAAFRHRKRYLMMTTATKG